MPRARADVVSPSPQPSPKRRGRFGSFCCRFSSGRLGISPASATLDCRAWPWLWTSPSATSLLFDSRLSLLRGWWSVEGFEGHWCLELVPMWSHPHPNPLPKGEGDLDPFVAGSVRGDWASRRLRQSWIVARGPGCGQAPALHLSYSILGCRCYEDGGRCRRVRVSLECLELVPMWSQSSPGNASPKRRGRFGSPFVAGSVRGDWASRRLPQSWIVARGPWLWTSPSATSLLFDSRLSVAYEVCKVVGGRVRGSLVPRARADVVSPSPQPSPKRRGRFGSFCCRFSSGRLGISPASAILDCRAWPWLWTSPSATSLLFDSRLSLLRGWWSVSPSSRVIGAPSSAPMWSHPHPNPLPKGEGDLDPFVARFSGAIGHSPASAIAGLSRVALAVDKPQRYISLIRFSAVVATRMVVGGSPAGVGIHPGPRSGTCPSIAIAHYSAFAGTSRYENEAWSFAVFGCHWRHPSPLDSGPVSGYGACFRSPEWRIRGLVAFRHTLRPRNTIFVPIAGMPAYQGMQGWGVGWWKSSRVIGASSSCRCGLTLTPTLSQKERAI